MFNSIIDKLIIKNMNTSFVTKSVSIIASSYTITKLFDKYMDIISKEMDNQNHIKLKEMDIKLKEMDNQKDIKLKEMDIKLKQMNN